jgi:hypothetical protein
MEVWGEAKVRGLLSAGFLGRRWGKIIDLGAAAAAWREGFRGFLAPTETLCHAAHAATIPSSRGPSSENTNPRILMGGTCIRGL